LRDQSVISDATVLGSGTSAYIYILEERDSSGLERASRLGEKVEMWRDEEGSRAPISAVDEVEPAVRIRNPFKEVVDLDRQIRRKIAGKGFRVSDFTQAKDG
jgi:hypothetical protein